MYIYNSHKDKVPFGAVKTGELSYYTFRVVDEARPNSVFMLVRMADGGVRKYPCAFENEDNGYVYSCVLGFSSFGLFYYMFEVNYDDRTDKVGRDENFDACLGSPIEWQLTVSDRAYVAPSKWGGEIIYHIFVDRFNRVGELPKIDYGTVHEDWDDDVDIEGKDGVYRADDFFCGNFRGIIDKLEYLKDLGVTTIFLSPIFYSHANHRYNTSDYMQIDPILGSEEDFAELVGKARIYGMRIMLDGVFNHSGDDSIYFNKFGYFDSFGAFQGTASPYRDWYTFNKDGTYHAWWGIDCVPTFRKNVKSLRKFLFGKNGVLAKWDKYDLDWRLDVVDELPNDFLDELHARVKHDNPKATIIGEVWEDASNKYAYGVLKPYFTQGQIDGVMNYVFREAILSFVMGGSAKDFARKIMTVVENYPKQCLDCCMTLLGSHDTERVLSLLGGANFDGWSKQRQKEYVLSPEQRRLAVDRLFVASILEYTLPGIPSIYYGDEAGVEGGKDPLNRRTYPWGRENQELLAHYKKLGIARGVSAEALSGTTRVYDKDGLLIMERKNGKDQVIVVANTTGEPKNFEFDGLMVDLMTNEVYENNVFLHNNLALILSKK